MDDPEMKLAMFFSMAPLATEEQAKRFLAMAGQDVEQAIQLYTTVSSSVENTPAPLPPPPLPPWQGAKPPQQPQKGDDEEVALFLSMIPDATMEQAKSALAEAAGDVELAVAIFASQQPTTSIPEQQQQQRSIDPQPQQRQQQMQPAAASQPPPSVQPVRTQPVSHPQPAQQQQSAPPPRQQQSPPPPQRKLAGPGDTLKIRFRMPSSSQLVTVDLLFETLFHQVPYMLVAEAAKMNVALPDASSLSFSFGFPPQMVDQSKASMTIGDIGWKNGEMVIVKIGEGQKIIRGEGRAILRVPRGVQIPQKGSDIENAIKMDNLTVVDFFATWCGPCKKMGPLFDAMANSGEFAGVAFWAVDVDKMSDVAQSYGVKAVPTFVLFKNGREVGRVSGGDPEALKDCIQKNK